MWIFIWFLLSVFVIGVSLWSVRILFQQKSAWKGYAEKMRLTYQNGPRFLDSPSLSGSIGAYGFGLYSEEQKTQDTRGQRFNTVLEIALRQGLPTTGALGTIDVLDFAQPLNLVQSLVPQDADWDQDWVVRARNIRVVEKYLTPSRLEIFKKIFRMKVVSAFFIFDGQDAILRVATADPLNNKARLEKIVKGLISQIEPLIVGPEEFAQLRRVADMTTYAPPSAPPAPMPVELPAEAPAASAAPEMPDAAPEDSSGS